MRGFLFRLAVLGMLLWVGLLMAPTQAGRVLNDSLAQSPFSHHIWQEVILGHVDAQGRVDFVKLRSEPRRFNTYLAQLAMVSPLSHPQNFPTRNDALAYWINAYNAVALRLIIDAYPARSLDEIPGLDTSTRYRLGGQPFSLAAVRERMITAFPGQPEALLALTSYSEDSPPLRHGAYEAEQLVRQLKAHAESALADPVMLRVEKPVSSIMDLSNPPCPSVTLSPALQFLEPALQRRAQISGNAGASLLDFLRLYAPPEAHALMGRACRIPIRYAVPDRRLRVLPAPESAVP